MEYFAGDFCWRVMLNIGYSVYGTVQTKSGECRVLGDAAISEDSMHIINLEWRCTGLSA